MYSGNVYACMLVHILRAVMKGVHIITITRNAHYPARYGEPL